MKSKFALTKTMPKSIYYKNIKIPIKTEFYHVLNCFDILSAQKNKA